MKQIGLFGGTFDPVHYGHLAVGKAAIARFAFDILYFIPAAVPPHKTERLITPFSHRVAMLRLALKDEPRFVVSEIEGQRNGPSYTIDTLSQFRQGLGPGADFFFIIGLDAFGDITTWNRYRKLLAATSFVVIDRPTHHRRTVAQVVAEDLPDYREAGTGVWRNTAGMHIYALEMNPVAVSSSLVRERLRRRMDVQGMVPQVVVEYLRSNGLPLGEEG